MYKNWINEEGAAMAKRIFVVEDEKCIADTLAAILCKAGYEASAFYNAQSALQEVSSCAPELVITDVDMPGMNGVEMAVCIREHCQGCKVLLFSGRASSLDLLEAAGTRGYDFELLAKPIHPRDLLARLENVGPEAHAS
jgi:DNA-binding response OmpR family regulator